MNHVLHTARRIAVAAAIAITSASAFATSVDSITNGGFSAPTLSARGFSYKSGLVDGWTYAGNSGVATNGSAFNVIGGDGQVALLQQAGSSISQVFDFTANLVSVTFSAEGRSGYGTNSISVLIDGVALVFNGATSLLPASTTSFTTYTSDLVALTAGSHTLSFVGNGAVGKDVTSFIDNVSLTAVPEPVTLGLFGLGLVALGAVRRKAKQA